MACETATHENFFVVRWGDSTGEDIERVIAEVCALAEKSEQPVFYLGILPPEMPKINDTQRDDFMRLSETLLPECGAFTVAIEATGFRGAIQRSALAAIAIVARKYRGAKFVDSVETALGVAPELLPDTDGVYRAIVEVGGTPPAGGESRRAPTNL